MLGQHPIRYTCSLASEVGSMIPARADAAPRQALPCVAGPSEAGMQRVHDILGSGCWWLGQGHAGLEKPQRLHVPCQPGLLWS